MELSKLMGCVKRPFIPSELFRNGLIGGAWFDPSDMTTLYQDAAGTTPVTAVEQPVGLMLDKSQGLMLGPELVSNGTFDSDTNGWIAGLAASVVSESGLLKVTPTGTAAGYAYTTIQTTIGKTYKVSYTNFVGTSSTGRFRAGDAPDALQSFNMVKGTAPESGSLVFTAAYSTTYITLTDADGIAGTYITIDNISVRELYGYHATQSITASRPTLSARKNILLATETLATQSVATLAAQYTLSFTGTGSVALSGAATGTLTGTGTNRVSLTFTPTAGTLTLTVSGSVTKAQLELGAVAGPYQRVNTATDYDTDPRYFPKYLRFDGVDDYLTLDDVFDIGSEGVSIATSVILFDATKSPIAGKSRATSGGGRYFLGVEPIAFLLASHDIAPPVSIAYSQSIGESVVLSAKLGPHGNRSLSLYKNANLLSTVNTSLTTASYDTTHPFWIGAYPNASGTTPAYGYLNGGIYGLIITKSALTDSQRIACERHLSRKSGVQL